MTLRNPNATSMSLTFKAFDIYGKKLLTQTIDLAAGEVLDAFGAGYFDNFDPISKIEWQSQGEIIDNLMVRRYPALEVYDKDVQTIPVPADLPTIKLEGNNTINAFGRIINDATGRDMLENYTIVNVPAGQVEITIYANLELAAGAVLKPALGMNSLIDIKVVGNVTLREGSKIDVSAIGSDGVAGGGEGGAGGAGRLSQSNDQSNIFRNLPAFETQLVATDGNNSISFVRRAGLWGWNADSGFEGSAGLQETASNSVTRGPNLGISQGAQSISSSLFSLPDRGFVPAYTGIDNRLTPSNPTSGGLRGGDGASGAAGGASGAAGFETYLLFSSSGGGSRVENFTFGGVGGNGFNGVAGGGGGGGLRLAAAGLLTIEKTAQLLARGGKGNDSVGVGNVGGKVQVRLTTYNAGNGSLPLTPNWGGFPNGSDGAAGALGAPGIGGAGGTLILTGTAIDAPEVANVDVSAGKAGLYYDERYFDQSLTDAQRQAFIYDNSRKAQDGRVVISSNVALQTVGGLDSLTADRSITGRTEINVASEKAFTFNQTPWGTLANMIEVKGQPAPYGFLGIKDLKDDITFDKVNRASSVVTSDGLISVHRIRLSAQVVRDGFTVAGVPFRAYEGYDLLVLVNRTADLLLAPTIGATQNSMAQIAIFTGAATPTYLKPGAIWAVLWPSDSSGDEVWVRASVGSEVPATKLSLTSGQAKTSSFTPYAEADYTPLAGFSATTSTGNFVFAASPQDSRIYVLNANDLSVRSTALQVSGVRDMAVAANGTRLLVSTETGILRFDIGTDGVLSNKVLMVGGSAGGLFTVAGGNEYAAIVENGQAPYYDQNDWAVRTVTSDIASGFTAAANFGGKTYAISQADGRLYTIDSNNSVVSSVVISGTLRDVAVYESKSQLLVATADRILAFDIAADGSLSNQRQVAGQEVWTLKDGEDGTVRTVQLGDRRYTISSSGYSITTISTNQTTAAAFLTPLGDISDVAIDPNGLAILVATNEGVVRFTLDASGAITGRSLVSPNEPFGQSGDGDLVVTFDGYSFQRVSATPGTNQLWLGGGTVQSFALTLSAPIRELSYDAASRRLVVRTDAGLTAYTVDGSGYPTSPTDIRFSEVYTLKASSGSLLGSVTASNGFIYEVSSNDPFLTVRSGQTGAVVNRIALGFQPSDVATTDNKLFLADGGMMRMALLSANGTLSTIVNGIGAMGYFTPLDPVTAGTPAKSLAFGGYTYSVSGNVLSIFGPAGNLLTTDGFTGPFATSQSSKAHAV